MKKVIVSFLSVLMITALTADDYLPGADFKVENQLMFHGDANFSDFSVLGAQSVLAGMDFDGDSIPEILFTMDENLMLLLSTSGSLGDPKCVKLSYKNIISNSYVGEKS